MLKKNATHSHTHKKKHGKNKKILDIRNAYAITQIIYQQKKSNTTPQITYAVHYMLI